MKQTFNHGLCVKGNVYDDYERDFYGLLKEIIEISFFGRKNKIFMFNCERFDPTRGVRVHPQHGIVEVKHK